jgi:hypothetical protein
MQPLQIKAKCVAPPDERLENIKSAIDRGLEEFGPSDVHDKEICIVGSGPSVRGQIKKIRSLKNKGCMVLAVKGAHDFLMEKNIVPHAALAVDPQPHIVKCFRKNLSGNHIVRPVYLIASQCCPEVFDYLSDQRVILWHLLASSSHEFLKGRPQIGGGSTSGSRAVVLAYMMGFRKMHLFGFDSCLQGKNPKKLRKVTGDMWGDEEKEPILELFCDGITFYADPAMAAQANEIQDVFSMLEGSKIKAYGHGLIQQVINANAKLGMEGYYAVGDEFQQHGIPKLRKGVAAHAERQLAAAHQGVFRGPGYPQSAQPD